MHTVRNQGGASMRFLPNNDNRTNNNNNTNNNKTNNNKTDNNKTDNIKTNNKKKIKIITSNESKLQTPLFFADNQN
jgi:hypothetical protein